MESKENNKNFIRIIQGSDFMANVDRNNVGQINIDLNNKSSSDNDCFNEELSNRSSKDSIDDNSGSNRVIINVSYPNDNDLENVVISKIEDESENSRVLNANKTDEILKDEDLVAQPTISSNEEIKATENLLRNSKIDTSFRNNESIVDLSINKSQLVLSWENLNVFYKKKKKLKDCFLNLECCFKKENNFNLIDDKNSTLALNKSLECAQLDKSSVETESNESFGSSSNRSSSSINYKENQQIINNVTGYVCSGELLAIMGASGSGKTTLLNCLNFRNLLKLNVNGKIKINGRQINADDINSKSAYIQQDDLFIETLTVTEHLTFLAMLKMGKNVSSKEKHDRVNQILDDFELQKCKNTKIGSYNNKKGISGGEKRRLAFASEILTDPVILFCDEPTSGLDSHMALVIINTLVKLARKGKIIICTIHQPSSQVFSKFDKLCLLAEGRNAYFGQRDFSYEYFKNINYVCPPQYNPIDYFIEILALKSNGVNNFSNIQAICDSYEKSQLKEEILKNIKKLNLNANNSVNSELNNDFHRKTPFKRHQKYNSSFFAQFIWLFWRQFLNAIREPTATKIMFVQSIIIGVFLGFTYFQQKNDQSSIQNKNGLLFLTLMQACLTYIFSVASHFHEQWNVVYRDIKNRVYSVLLYYLAKTLSEVPQNIVFPAITVTIIYWLANIHSNYNIYFAIMSIIVMASNTAIGFGSLLAILTPNLDSTVGLMGPTFFPMLVFSGFLINSSSIPIYFVWIKYISWVFYANESIMIILWKNTNQINCPNNLNFNLSSNSNSNGTLIDLSQENSCLNTGKEVLKNLSMSENNLSLDICMLIGFLIFWPALAGIILYIKSKR